MTEFKNVELDCTDTYYSDKGVTISMPLTSAIAIVQALQFAINNKELFKKTTTKCELCYEAILPVQQELAISFLKENEKKHNQYDN